MRSLFARILIWFVAAVLVTGVALLIAAALAFDRDRERAAPFQVIARMQLRAAIHAYESGGPEEARETLEKLLQDTSLECILTDDQGRDLLRNEDRSRLLRRARRSRLPFRIGRKLVIDTRSENGEYWLFLIVPSPWSRTWLFHPSFIVVFGLAVLLCYLLATHLTTPVRQLQQAVDRFGGGDFGARVNSVRSDELGDLARTFDRMADRIQQLLAAERRLLQDLSHELRSPLARLGVAAELARSEGQREQALNQIQKESDRMDALLGELLQVTRTESDPSSLVRETVDVAVLLREIVADAAVEAQSRHCSINARIPEQLSILANPELLHRAIENVLRNAIRHAPEATGVDVNLNQNDSRVCLIIRDRGPGVPEESLQYLFDPFYRVEPDRGRTRGGVGLGLSISRRAVELHGGTIRARNASPGLQVEIELPERGGL